MNVSTRLIKPWSVNERVHTGRVVGKIIIWIFPIETNVLNRRGNGHERMMPLRSQQAGEQLQDCFDLCLGTGPRRKPPAGCSPWMNTPFGPPATATTEC